MLKVPSIDALKLNFVDLISASLKSSKSDEINNDDKAVEKKPSDEEVDSKLEKFKPKQMVGLFPLDLRSELKNRIGGGKAGFSLKKSTTNVDIGIRNRERSEPVPIKLPGLKSGLPTDLLKQTHQNELRKRMQEDSDEDDGQEKLSFKEKLQLIERSSSKIRVNPL